MYYKVFDCTTLTVYEEREYKCLGHWRDGELLYTYTQRYDDVAAGTYECFVGSIISDEQDYIIIKEAGEHCQRKPDALQSGMKLVQQEKLTSNSCQKQITITESNTNISTLIIKEWNYETTGNLSFSTFLHFLCYN